VKVSGLRRREAQEAVKTQLQATLNSPEVALTIDESRLETGITGQHLVAPNGTINLGIYGEVKVKGQTIEEASKAVEDKLAAQFNDPMVSVDVYGYNSKVFYVIQQGQSIVGESIHRFPYTGNETFLDAAAQLGGGIDLSAAKIWISRPGRGDREEQKIDINWDEASAGRGSNPQILPGDRVFIEGARQITTQYVTPGYYVPPTPVTPQNAVPSRGTTQPYSIPTSPAPSAQPSPYQLPRYAQPAEPQSSLGSPVEQSNRNPLGLEIGNPVVVRTIPEAGLEDVDPSLAEIKVTFSRHMSHADWSFCQTTEDSFPKANGDVKYLADRRTCVMPVKLEAGKTYNIWLNSPDENGPRNFVDESGHAAAPYLLVFKTKEPSAEEK
jgi:protein involved in polysaccharide export with SLBB domain